jgi:hypothetical protein
MCLQCVAESQEIIRDIVPGYALHRATKDVPDEWPVGHYGVVKMNDPMLVFALPDDATEDDILMNSLEMSDRFGFSLWEGYDFTSACVAAGYVPDTDGYNVLAWFMEHVARRLKEVPVEQKVVISNNVIRATLKLIAHDFMKGLIDRLVIDPKINFRFKPELVDPLTRIQITHHKKTADIKLIPLLADFTIPNVVHMLHVPELLPVHMDPAIEQMAERINQMIAKAEAPVIVGMRRVAPNEGEIAEYVETGNFGIKASTVPDPHHMRQRYFIEMLIGVA